MSVSRFALHEYSYFHKFQPYLLLHYGGLGEGYSLLATESKTGELYLCLDMGVVATECHWRPGEKSVRGLLQIYDSAAAILRRHW